MSPRTAEENIGTVTSGEESGPGGLLRPLDWSRRIEEALERDLFVLHGQRIVEVISGETMRHELFLRMVDRKRLIPAGEFVMAAEEFGSIREIDRWVVSRAIEVAGAGMPVDLNLSVRSTDEAMVGLVIDRLELTGADPADVVFELSEEQMTEGLDAAGAFVNAAADLGCGIALDGFVEGGPESFLLRRLPISYVKLGAPFIEGLAEDRGKRRAVSSAVLKAHRSGQRVIAQGVETLAVLELLEELGVDEAQGHALGPPESLESLAAAGA
jgi:EAL domain-containing protein (putative c-di-GMP-specific phosphodiesterase class I)